MEGQAELSTCIQATCIPVTVFFPLGMLLDSQKQTKKKDVWPGHPYCCTRNTKTTLHSLNNCNLHTVTLKCPTRVSQFLCSHRTGFISQTFKSHPHCQECSQTLAFPWSNIDYFYSHAITCSGVVYSLAYTFCCSTQCCKQLCSELFIL